MTRRGCCLCEDAKALLAGLLRESSATGLAHRLVETDIDLDPVLRMRYGHSVPVILVGGVRIAELRIDAEQLAGLRTALGLADQKALSEKPPAASPAPPVR